MVHIFAWEVKVHVSDALVEESKERDEIARENNFEVKVADNFKTCRRRNKNSDFKNYIINHYDYFRNCESLSINYDSQI